MKKVFKILLWTIVILIVISLGAGYYMYQTNPTVKAIVDNDESRLFYFPVKGTEGIELIEHQEIPLQVEDTVIVYTYFFPSQADSVIANVFFLHGSGGNMGRYAHLIKPLADYGYQVFAIDWRGFGKSNGRPTHANALADTRLAFEHALKNESVKNYPMIVYGQSMGGQVATRLTREMENRIDALVLDGSVSSFANLVEDSAPIEFLKQRARSNPQDLNRPYVALEDISEISSTPKLIIQSQDDKTVLPKRGISLFENAQAPKEYWQTEGGHIQTLADYPVETPQRMAELIRTRKQAEIADL